MAPNVNTFVVRRPEEDQQNKSKTLVLLYGWFGASERATKRYCDLYHRYGFDVIFIKSYLKQFAWPKNSVRLSNDLLSHLNQNCQHYDNLLVHAFSLGAFNFTVNMNDLYTKPEVYKPLQNKIRGVVYDSLTVGSLPHMSRGVASGLSKNKMARALIPMAMGMYFWSTHRHTVQHYDKYIELFKKKPLEIPTLLFYCKNDPMADYDTIRAMITDWKSGSSFPIQEKCWDISAHALHLLKHQDDYISTLHDFLRSIPEIQKNIGKELVTESKL